MMGIRFRAGLGIAIAFCGIAVSVSAQQASSVIPISTLTRAYMSQTVVIQGKVSAYIPPGNDRQPYSFMLKDSTGEIRVVIWRDTWAKITFNDKLQQVGQEVTARGRVSEFNGALQCVVESKDSIALGFNSSLTAPVAVPSLAATPAAPAEKAVPISWQTDLQAAMTKASKEKKNILVFFSNPDAENSNYIEGTILKDGKISNVVAQKYVAVKISVKEQSDMASRLGVFRGGVVNLYRPDGAAIRQLTTIHTTDDLLDQIK